MSPATRPYFVPADLDFDALPMAVQVAVNEIVQPAYDQLVVEATNPLERSAGASFVYLLFLELLEQFDLGAQVGQRMAQPAGADGYSPREADLNRLLRLIGAKTKAGGFLLRVRSLRAGREPHDPIVPPP